jgi:hypothetical protein
VVPLEWLQSAHEDQLVTRSHVFGKPGEGPDQSLHVLAGLDGPVVHDRPLAEPGNDGPRQAGLVPPATAGREGIRARRPHHGEAVFGDAELVGDVVGSRLGQGHHVVGGPDQFTTRPVPVSDPWIAEIGVGEELRDEVVDRDHQPSSCP